MRIRLFFILFYCCISEVNAPSGTYCTTTADNLFRNSVRNDIILDEIHIKSEYGDTIEGEEGEIDSWAADEDTGQ